VGGVVARFFVVVDLHFRRWAGNSIRCPWPWSGSYRGRSRAKGGTRRVVRSAKGSRAAGKAFGRIKVSGCALLFGPIRSDLPTHARFRFAKCGPLVHTTFRDRHNFQNLTRGSIR